MRLSNWGQALDSERGIMCKKIICFLILPLRLLLKLRRIPREAKRGGRYLKMETGGTLCLVSVLLAVQRAFLVLALVRTRFAFDSQQQVFIAFVGSVRLLPSMRFETPAVIFFYLFIFKYSKYLYSGEGGNTIVFIDASFCLSSFKGVCGVCGF